MTQGLVQKQRADFLWYEGPANPISLPLGRDEFEYQLVIHPDVEVYSKVLAESECFRKLYTSKPDQPAPPYISLAKFIARESMEETLIRWIQRACSGQKSFNVTLNNYSGIPPHTIYLRVQDHMPFNLLAQKLSVIGDYIQSNNCPPVKWNNRPCLSLSGPLQEDVYERAMREYSQRSFCESFVANELVLLRKSSVTAWKIVNIFGLIPQ